MTVTLLWFMGASAVVIAAGMLLSRTSDCIADRTGLGGLVIGSFLLAGATTLPEIFTGISAVRIGAQDMAVGGMVGSCLLNLAILGLLDILYCARFKRGIFTRVAPGHGRSATLAVVLLAVVGVGVLHPSPVAVGGVGIGGVLIAAIYVVGTRAIVLQHREDPEQEAVETVEAAETRDDRWEKVSTLWVTILFALAAVIISLASPRLAQSGQQLADGTGIGQTFFGTVFMSIVTSLPEFVACVAAFRLGAFDLAVGNVLGSNTINIFVLFILDIADRTGALFSHVNGTHAITALAAIAVTGVILQVILSPRGRHIWGVWPDGLAILITVAAGIGAVYVAR